MSEKTRICAVVVNDLGEILPYSCQSTKSQCEEWCEENMFWDSVRSKGAKIVQAEIRILEGE